jgi:hypothetical protein
MVNAYPKEYLDKYEIIDEMWTDDKEPDAKKIRDRRARELRKHGWTVQVETVNSPWDSSRIYRVFAEKKRGEK